MPRFPPAERSARLEDLADVCDRRQDAKAAALASNDWAACAALNAQVAGLLDGLGGLTRAEQGSVRDRAAALRAARGVRGLSR